MSKKGDFIEPILEPIQEVILKDYLTGEAGEFGFYITVCGEKDIGKTYFLEYLLRRIEKDRRIFQIGTKIKFPSDKRVQILKADQTDFRSAIENIALRPGDIIAADELASADEIFPFFNFALQNKISAIAVFRSSFQILPMEVRYPKSLTVVIEGNKERKLLSLICYSDSASFF